MSDLRTKIAETLAGLEGVTIGPWEAQGTESEGEERGSNFIVGSQGQGLVGASLSQPTEFVTGDFARVDANAAHIARCDPDFIRQLCEAALAGLEPSTPAPGRIEALQQALRNAASGMEAEALVLRTAGYAKSCAEALERKAATARAALSPNGAAK